MKNLNTKNVLIGAGVIFLAVWGYNMYNKKKAAAIVAQAEQNAMKQKPERVA